MHSDFETLDEMIEEGILVLTGTIGKKRLYAERESEYTVLNGLAFVVDEDDIFKVESWAQGIFYMNLKYLVDTNMVEGIHFKRH